MIGDEPFTVHVEVSDFGPIDPGEIVGPDNPNQFVGPQLPKQNWSVLLIILLIVYLVFGGKK